MHLHIRERSRPTRQFALTLLVLAFAFPSCLSQSAGVGESLLDDYIKVTAVSNARDVSTRKMRSALDELDGRIQALRGEVPEEFFVRYRRLIDVTRTVIAEKQDEDSRAKILEYVKATTGAVPTERELIAATAEACTREVSNLRTLLRK
jgi:hypothetical protein